MSYTEIYGVKTNGEVVFVGETKNAWRGAMHVWTKLCQKYNIEAGFGGFQELWKLTDTGALDDFENITLKSTFDNVVVKKEDIPMLLEAFRLYESRFPNSSLLEQAEIIKKDILEDKEMIAVCWNQTSVNANPWTDGYDEDNEEKIPYNVLTGERH
ncbi:hypothetical protein AAGG74_15285 [Bacillus mexicanus]|uniref:hypothetical protein n=1 Tax=Bacillus mexicanus TaxID=2834415 RepID=UPI003D1AE60C